MDGVFFYACDRYLLSRVNRVKPIRLFTVRRFYSHIQSCFANPVKVIVHPFKRGYGYMLDRGEVHILADLLFQAPHVSFITVLLHETAHIVLSQSERYGELLQLDATFAETFLKGQYSGSLKTVTPIEFFAQLLADQWLSKVAEQISDVSLKESVQKELDRTRSKLLSAIDILNEIKACSA